MSLENKSKHSFNLPKEFTAVQTEDTTGHGECSIPSTQQICVLTYPAGEGSVKIFDGKNNSITESIECLFSSSPLSSAVTGVISSSFPPSAPLEGKANTSPRGYEDENSTQGRGVINRIKLNRKIGSRVGVIERGTKEIDTERRAREESASNSSIKQDGSDEPTAYQDDTETGSAPQYPEKKEIRRKIPRSLFGVLAVTLILSLAILIVFLVVRFYDATEPEKQSASEDSAPPKDLPLEEHVLSLLPDYTVQNINDNSPYSPQTRAFHWLLNDPNVESYDDFRMVQRFALGTFYYATGGNSTWRVETNWMSYEHHVSI